MTHARADLATATARPGSGVPQRKCACGGATGSTGECAGCRKQRLQRLAASPAPAPSVAPPIVHDVLRSSGRPLDAGARAEMEPRFGHSFADVRVHADGRAAESARAVDAAAYTVGRSVVFGAGRYAPGSESGRRLIAHELAHVVQQRGAEAPAGGPIPIGSVADAAEREADEAARTGGPAGGATALRRSPLAVRRVYELDVTPATRFATTQGTFHRFPAEAHHTNQVNRPKFQHPGTALVTYTGPGAAGTESVHPAVLGAMSTLMTDMRAEGARIGDQSLSGATVESAYRAPTAHEGALYLGALRRTIALNPTIFGTLAFPAAQEALAQSELGFTGSATHNRFRDAVAGEPGWTPALAARLVEITAGFKAPRGASTHHSGLVADIGWQYATSATNVQAHGEDRTRNAEAFRSAAGVWLSRHAVAHGFDTYDTSKEIWHQEWRSWRGTAADPAGAAPATLAPSATARYGTPSAPWSLRRPGQTNYREDTEMLECLRIMGPANRDSCERDVRETVRTNGRGRPFGDDSEPEPDL